MEKMFYSASARGFYGARTHKGRIPDDAVPVSRQRYAALIEAQNAGAEIVPDEQGRFPIALKPDHRRNIEYAVKAEAKRRIEAILPLHKQLNAIRAGGAEHDAAFQKIDEIRAASNLIEQYLANSTNPLAFPVGDHPLWP